MANKDGSTHGIEKFDGTNFVLWRMQIEDYPYDKKLHSPLLETKPKRMSNGDWGFLDRVLGVIRLTLSNNVVHNVANENLTWD